MLLRTFVKNEWVMFHSVLLRLLMRSFFQADICNLPPRYEDAVSQDYLDGSYHVTDEELCRCWGLSRLWVDYR